MRFSLAWLACFLFVFLMACSSPALPTPTSAVSVLTPTVPVTSTPLPTVALTQTPQSTPTSQLVISLITPTLVPTLPPPTETLTASVPAAAPTPTSLPSLGTAQADATLVSILQRCWQVSDPRQLNGTLEAHQKGFDCARADFKSLAQANPSYALVHRMLAWGYYYRDNNTTAAVQEYGIAAQLYHAAGDGAGESEARLRRALLLMPSSVAQGCNELAAAVNAYSQNTRAYDYYKSYNCADKASGGSSGGNSGGSTAPVLPTLPNISLDEVRGKILFKSDRGYEGYYMMDPDGRNVKTASQAVYDAAAKFESFSPDHTEVAGVRYESFNSKFGYNNDIWVTDPSGGNGRPLANPANDYDPAWSPHSLFDGREWLAFVSNRGDITHGDTQGEEIWMMHSDGTNSLRLTCHGPNFSKHPSWSPDAGKLVYYSNYSTGHSQIYILDLSTIQKVADPCSIGEGSRNLSNNDYNDSVPIWVK